MNIYHNILEKDIGENSVMISKELIRQMDLIIELRMESIQSYSNSLIGNPEILASNKEYGSMDNPDSYIMKKDNEWISSDYSNEFISNITNNNLSETIRKEFSLVKIDSNVSKEEIYSEVFITNKYGVNVAQSNMTSDFYQGDEIWWQEAKNNGIYLGDLEFDNSSGIYSLPIAARIGSDEEFIGVIKAVYSLKDIFDIIEILNLLEPSSEEKILGNHKEHLTHHVNLVNKEGKIIFSTKGNRTYENYSERVFNKIRNLSDYSKSYYFIDKGDQEGEDEELFAYSYSIGYGKYKGFDWVLIVEHDTKEILAPINDLRNRFLIFYIIITIIAAGVGMSLSQFYSRPLEKLSAISKEIGKGNFDIKTDIKRNDEIGALAGSIDNMTLNLKNLDKTKNDFLNVVSHELKTPLTAIFAYLDILDSSKDKLSKDQIKYLDTIRRNGKHLQGLVTNILEVARITANKFELNPAEIDIKKKLETIIQNLKAVSDIEGISLVLKVKNLPKTIITDELRFEEIFNNLINNAIKFTEKGSITVEAEKINKSIRFKVKDTGIGIPKDKIKNLFQEFYQVDSTSTRKYGGTGLGLSITKKLIELQGGKIWVDSIPNKGTTFSFILPIKPANKSKKNVKK